MSIDKKMRIGILGDGGWGTALAILLVKKGYAVGLWGVFPAYLEVLEKKRENIKFLPGIRIPSAVEIIKDAKEIIENSSIIVVAVPSKYLRETLKKFTAFDFCNKIILSVVKGMEINSYLRPSEVIQDVLGKVKIGVLSGPSIAREVAQGIPTAVVIAAREIQLARKLQRIFSTENFRVYTHSDVIGVELGGALKNIIALACGISDGLGFGTNTKSALLNRGLLEIIRLGVTLGAQPETFWGLSGLGDLVTTCFSPYSRNRRVGEEIGKGKKITAILKKMEMIAEGVFTVRAAYALAKKYKIEMPITEQVYKVLYENKSPSGAVKELMTRKLKPEFS
ncbi:MAG: NAD(P)-dependent glycerol-3-phosphate dehydrogenase [Candidatus Omnitrophica bacterium]|nr:NAD(P)-dependent glycerol-3-phosphate dehydrogenase [Candidatus Omnitrophota bacterium]MCM8793649.1 NAD(P)-dependent glycerol-3-phosphate dehydrogenase [Candidatus Omnitrophota bacterium]